jgi:hypothetical protein
MLSKKGNRTHLRINRDAIPVENDEDVLVFHVPGQVLSYVSL